MRLSRRGMRLRGGGSTRGAGLEGEGLVLWDVGCVPCGHEGLFFNLVWAACAAGGEGAC